MSNPFVLDKKEYKRAINPIGQYVNQASQYLHLITGKDLEVCKEFITNGIKNNTLPGSIIDPKIKYLERQDNGDRVEKESTLVEYINSSLTEGELISPTLTTYINPKVKESLLVNFVDDNIAARGVAKKAAFAAKAAGNKELATIKGIEQTNRKLSNNSVSGAHVSASTPLYNKTAHSTLTSTCRSTSGYGNANNEKFLCGNRHYWSPQIVINSIISIITYTDYSKIIELISVYDLKPLTVDETMECITYSTDLYWMNTKETAKIRNLVSKLNDLQRQAFVYTGDMFHLMKHNQELVRTFIKRLSSKVTGDIENPIDSIHKSSEDIVNLAHQICATEMKGKGKDYKAMIGTPELNTLAHTVLNIESTLSDYSSLIKGLWVTNNVPASVAYFPESIRRAALTSDTDSTIFTVQDWVMWYNNTPGTVDFDDESIAIAATMIFLASQTITHVLAKMSANFGIEQKRLHQIAMKNEFKFDVFVPTQVAKHYYAIISCQEGNVFDELNKEIKGVHLKSSNAPLKITKAATAMMESIMASVMAGKKISIIKILNEIGDIERTIHKSILAGELEYLRLAQIKMAESYTSSERSSPYGHHLFWSEVFAPKYGQIALPPYSCIKVSTTLDNPSNLKEWIDKMKDRDLAQRLTEWLIRSNKKVIPTILLPVEVIRGKGIPPELVDIIDARTMVSDLSRIFYLILETLGFFTSNDKNTKLVYDSY